MYDYLNPLPKQICEAIDAVEPMTPPSYIREGILTRIAEIDQNLVDIKLALITYNDGESAIHEFGIPAKEAMETLAGRRDRLVKFLEESGLDNDGPGEME
jgi:hypothetical protein